MDPEHDIVGLHLYDGQLRITSILNGNFCNFFTIRMDELNIIHMCFLSAAQLNSTKPVVAVLYEDTRHARHLKTYIVDLEQKELEDGPWFHFHSSMVNTAEMIIPVNAYGGLLLVGESLITYLTSHQAGQFSIPVHETSFKCYAMVDTNRYVLSDHVGHLYMLLLATPNNAVEEISCQRLGRDRTIYLTVLDVVQGRRHLPQASVIWILGFSSWDLKVEIHNSSSSTQVHTQEVVHVLWSFANLLVPSFTRSRTQSFYKPGTHSGFLCC